MKNLLNNDLSATQSTLSPRVISLVVLSMLIGLAFVFASYSGQLFPQAHAASSTHASTTATSTTYPIKVFFSQFPKSLNTNPPAVFPVDRMSPTIAVGTFSLQLLIAGPTLSERQAGYFTELNTMLSGPSNCAAPLPVGGPDFTLTLNMKGPVPETGTATVKFCRLITSPGIGADARVITEVDATLKQFANIQKVVILTMDGHCFGDESGKDFCLR